MQLVGWHALSDIAQHTFVEKHAQRVNKKRKTRMHSFFTQIVTWGEGGVDCRTAQCRGPNEVYVVVAARPRCTARQDLCLGAEPAAQALAGTLCAVVVVPPIRGKLGPGIAADG